MAADEEILVIPARLLDEVGRFQGFDAGRAKHLPSWLADPGADFRPRSEMEEDVRFKQLIPYVVFEYDDPRTGLNLFQYVRGTGQGERRLHARVSIGVGGHISREDAGLEGDPMMARQQEVDGVPTTTPNLVADVWPDGSLMSAYHRGMAREIGEELVLPGTPEATLVGLINDDGTDVGRVHLGVVHLCRLASPEVRPREADLLDAGFSPLETLRSRRDAMESWSRLVFDALYG